MPSLKRKASTHLSIRPPPSTRFINPTPPSSSHSTAATLVRHAVTLPLNRNIDRLPTKLNQQDNSKLTICINHPDQDPTTSTYKFSIDWSDRHSVTALNEWRRDVFRYWLGSATSRPQSQGRVVEIVRFHEEEREWLLKAGKEKESGEFTWERVAVWFNDEFEGLLLDGCIEPRPKRTGKQVMACYNTMMRKAAKTPEIKQEQSEEDTDSDMDDWELSVITKFFETVQRNKKKRNLV